jgi:hypothetical protein
MNTQMTLTAAILVLLTAACGPADGVPGAYAQPTAATVALHPEVAADATDGQVYEYH